MKDVSASCVVFLSVTLLGYSLNAQVRPPATASPLEQFSAAIENLARASSAAVVQISVRGRAPLEDSAAPKAGFISNQRGTGSGVIVDSNGYIVTNAHVITNARHIDVSVLDPEIADGPVSRRHFGATVVGTDRDTDLAVLKIEAQGLPTLSFVPDSDTLRQGQVVLALGSPLGLDNSLTVGFVSAPRRYLGDEKPNYYVQTDASINPGNSGGPLLDIGGRIVGINTMILSQSGGSEGIGLAVPGNTVRQIYQGLRKDGRIQRGAIGIVPQDITPVMADALKLDRSSGVILGDVMPHGAAEAAGLQQGDMVVAVDGKPIERSRDMAAAIFQRVMGDEVTIDIQRGKQRLKKTVAVGARPRTPVDLADLATTEAHRVRKLGVLALTLDERVTPVLANLRRLYGVVVAAIPLEFAGANPGLIAGDVIYEINGIHTKTLEELKSWLEGKKNKEPVSLLIERSGQLMYLSFELE